MIRRANPKQQGMALVMVLWLIVLMSVIAAGHSRSTHIESRLAARHVETSAARQVAEAAVQLAIFDLLTRPADERMSTNGRSLQTTLLGRNVDIAVRRASGYVDINNADEGMLYALFLATGVDDATATQLAHSVMDWRDGDDLLRMHGAEDDDYRMAGLPWTARDGPFERVDELRYVYGMTGHVYRSVLPYVTVYSGHNGVDLAAAPAFLVNALAQTGRVSSDSSSAAGDTGFGNFHIIVTAHGAEGVQVSLEAVVEVSGSKDEQYRILEWREHARGEPAQIEEPSV